jgi:regulator of sigma E protease
VADVAPGLPAEAAGLRRGDKVLRIGGQDARDQQTQVNEIILAPDQLKPVDIERDGVPLTISMRTGQDPVFHLGAPGWRLIQDGEGPPEIEMVLGGSPAEKSGLLHGDKVVGIDGRSPQGELELKALLEKSIGRPVTLEIRRAGQDLTVVVTPRDESGIGKIGVLFAEGNRVHHELGLSAAFAASLDWNAGITRSVFQTLGRLVKREISVRAFSGPIEIARVSREAVRGGESFFTLLALISLQLGILNLMPIPVLDGGHILILACEGVLRRDLSEKLKERVMTVGFVFLLAFFGLVIFFDILKARM